MRAAYFVLGIGFLAVFGFVYYFLPYTPMYTDTTMASLKLRSSAFVKNARIPMKYTCDADNISPPLTISNIPAGVKSLVVTLDDPDVPKALKPDGVFDHWVLYNIPPETKEIPEGGFVGTQGLNGRSESAYTGPCPPTEYEPTEHRYFFRVYALDTTLEFGKSPTKAEVQAAMQGHIVAEAKFMGRYDRNQ